MNRTFWNIDIIDDQHVMGRLVGHHFTTKNKKPPQESPPMGYSSQCYKLIYIYIIHIIIRYKLYFCGRTST
jgi:hypothetical protein